MPSVSIFFQAQAQERGRKKPPDDTVNQHKTIEVEQNKKEEKSEWAEKSERRKFKLMRWKFAIGRREQKKSSFAKKNIGCQRDFTVTQKLSARFYVMAVGWCASVDAYVVVTVLPLSFTSVRHANDILHTLGMILITRDTFLAALNIFVSSGVWEGTAYI